MTAPTPADWHARIQRRPVGLTLWPEWAWAVGHLGKRIENRSWHPPRWAVGALIAIHGGAAFGGQAGRVRDGAAPEAWGYAARAMLAMALRAGQAPVGPVTMARLIAEAQSKIVAVGRLSSVVTESADPWFVGPLGWVLSDVVTLPEPVPCRGSQGLWTLPDDVRAAVTRQLPTGR